MVAQHPRSEEVEVEEAGAVAMIEIVKEEEVVADAGKFFRCQKILLVLIKHFLAIIVPAHVTVVVDPTAEDENLTRTAAAVREVTVNLLEAKSRAQEALFVVPAVKLAIQQR
jgi:hypothetical protein